MTADPTRYRTIVADPPWPFEWRGGATRVNGRGESHRNAKASVRSLPYRSMTLEEIAALPVRDLAAPDAHLYLWVPDRLLIDGVGALVAKAWGFNPGRLLIWHKTGFGLGTFPRPQHEAMIVCRRGKLPFTVADEGSVQTWKLPYENGARKHSAKPDGALDLIERASPGPRVELFARRERFGWDTWGDESLGTATMPVGGGA